jgi:hypothetical protein
VSLRISLPYAPPPFGQAKHIDSDNFPGATPGSVQIGKDFGCSQTIACDAGRDGHAGVQGDGHRRPASAHAREPDVTARAVPVSWSNRSSPATRRAARRSSASMFAKGMHDGSRERDRAQEVLHRHPGDPVERNVVINPADRVTATTNPADRSNAAVNPAQRVNPGATQAAKASPASRFAGASRVADDLNPQPLPPGPPGPPDRSKAAAARATATSHDRDDVDVERARRRRSVRRRAHCRDDDHETHRDRAGRHVGRRVDT